MENSCSNETATVPASGKHDTTHAYQNACALLRARDPTAAVQAFESLLITCPDEARLWHGLGLSRASLSDTDGALEAFRKATACAPSSWPSWQSIAGLSPNEAERLNALAMARNSLAALCACTEATPAVRMKFVEALFDLRQYEMALGVLAGGPDACPEDGLLHLAKAQYRLGQFEQAFGTLCLAIHSASTAGAPKAAFEPAGATLALRDVTDILQDAGLQPFLTAGTLLGFIREGRPLAHDRDIDIGLVCKREQRPDVCAVLRRHPALRLARDARPGDRYFETHYRGTGVDIFLYETDGRYAYSGFSDLAGDIQWRHRAFGLEEACFNGISLRIPVRPAEYLTQTYGAGWRASDPHFCSAVSSPALFGVHAHARASYAAIRAFQANLTGEAAKAQALEAQSPYPFTSKARAS